MAQTTADLRIRPLDTVDIGEVVRIDEKITGLYRPEVWESRIGYYLRRDPDAALVAEDTAAGGEDPRLHARRGAFGRVRGSRSPRGG
ncbi:MAG: hypothetical protein HC897_05870, partial [Thermoanaerobaculia bacterium]|nr:hypothetical protein [Thermoanaerobaculia bacterium]